MSIENMKMVSDAEEEAMKIRKDAQKEARQILEAGRREAAAALETANAAADQAYRKTLAEAEEQAQAAYEAHLDAVRAECASMKAQAREHKEEAVKVIIGKVVGSSGNC